MLGAALLGLTVSCTSLTATYATQAPIQRAASGRRQRSCVSASGALDGSYDAAQLAMMEEMCIVVDFDDTFLGEGTKKDVHLIDGVCMVPGGPPHRAFSVFLFDENWNLLMQKRCRDKILFPEHWANTCCSHPLADNAMFLGSPIHGEADGAGGAIRAARRKLGQELGIDADAVPEESFTFLTKVHYKAPLPGPMPRWGEHEVDYILLCQRPRAEIEATLRLNPNEVVEARWLTQEECREFVDGAPHPEDATRPQWLGETVRHSELISPWFGAIARELLHPWWSALKRGDTVSPDGVIHRLAGSQEAMEGARTPFMLARAGAEVTT